MSDRYDNLIARLLVACNLDPEILIGSHEAAILSTVQRKVAEGDKRIEAAQQAVARWQETAEGEHVARLRAEAERDRLVEGCIQETWRKPCRTMANAWDDELTPEHDYQWRFGAMGDFVSRKDQAVAAVRKAAGLETSS